MADRIPCEWLLPNEKPPEPVILYLHGGGWVLGWYNNHRWMAAHLGQTAHCRVLAVDYRLAPEHPFPAALEDCVAAYRWLLNSGVSPNHIILAGDSAGGNLTLTTALALRERGEPLPAALVCLSPVTDLAHTGETFFTQKDPMMTPKFAIRLMDHYAGSNPKTLPLLSPLYAELAGLPPLLIQVGEEELLLSDAVRFADKAKQAGVKTTLEIWPRMWHVFQMFVPYLPEAQEAVEQVGKFVRAAIQPRKELRVL
ncbi:MAG: alpha/beta hydrolase [Anaerolineales bacterium]